MFGRKLMFVGLAASLVLSTPPAHGEDSSALLDLLVRKHIITEKDAAEVRVDLAKTNPPPTTSSASKLKLSTPLTELELYGDARVRYEVRNGETGNNDPINGPHDTQQRNRERYRLRLGLRGTLADDWFFNIRLETSQSPRSTNVTFGDDTSSSSPGGGGPFAKGSDGINVGQVYLGYKGFKDITLIAGKLQNPFVTTSMVWDADINPEGLSEQWKHTFALGGSGPSQSVESKDGKEVIAAAPSGMTIDVFVNFGQFVYDDANPENPIGPSPQGVPNTDAFLLGWQVGAKFNFTKDMYFQFAPTVYNYTGAGDTFNTTFVGDPAFRRGTTTVVPNQTGVNNLLVFEMPAEFGWKIGKIPMRIFGDFAVNLDGDERAAAAGHPDEGDQRYAYQIGLGIGKIKVKNDWALSAFWQHTEQYALDPNLVDSDLFDSRVNIEGVAVTLGYAVSDAVTANLTYGYGHRADRNLGTGGVGDIGINALDKYQLFQADLNFKF